MGKFLRIFFIFQFTVEVNPLKDYTGSEMEIIVTGDPGSYVGILGTDGLIYSLQGGNDLTFASVSFPR